MSPKQRYIVVAGAGGHAKVVADLARRCNIGIIGFVDDVNGGRKGEQFCGSTIFRDAEHVRGERTEIEFGAIVAIGDCEARVRIAAELQRRNFRLVTLIHPAAVVADSVRVGAGTVIMAGAVINANADIGDNAIVNTGAIIEHDCVIEDGAHICPGVRLGGGVKVGSETWIGIGAIVKDRVRIGKGVTVGAGSLVLKDVADRVTVYGSPASVRG